MKKLVPILALLYPLLIYFSKGSPYFMPIALGLGGVLILELFWRLPRAWQLAGALGILALFLAMQIFGLSNMLRLYPFVMSLSMLLIFASSKDPKDNPMIGPFRKRLESDPRLLPLLHRAKWIWIIGLSINSLILGVFLFAFPLEQWILYASFHSYLLLASLLLLSVAYVALGRRSWR